MSKNATALFYICLTINLILGVGAMVMGFFMAATMMLFSSIITYTVCYVWITQRQDLRLNMRGKLVALPILAIFISFLINFDVPIELKVNNQELVEAVGQLLLSRYRMAIWAIGAVFMATLILSASVINRGGTK